MKNTTLLRPPLQSAIYLITLALILLSIFALANKVWNDVSSLETAKTDNMQWALSQIEVDYLNLKVSQSEVRSDVSTTYDGLRDSFDVFYSRIATFREGQLYASLNDDPETSAIVSNIWNYLQKFVPLIDGNNELLARNLSDFAQDTDDLVGDIRTLSLKGIGLSANVSDKQRNDVSATLIMIAFLTLILVVALLTLLWVFLRQYRRMKVQTNNTQIASSRLNAVVTSALDGVIVINRNAKILEFNNAAEQIFGYKKEEAVGGDLAEMIVPEHFRRAHKDGMQRYLDTGEKRVVGKGRVQLEAKRKSGNVFPVELSISSAQSHEGEVFVAFLRDISDRVEQEEELKQARDDALAGEKAKAELLAVMSHEMRTPLNGMLGTLELMQDTHLSARQEQYLEIIDTSGKLLLHHVNNVLDISRLDAGKFESDLKKFNLSELLTQICESQRPSAEAKGNRVSIDLAGIKEQFVIGDDVRLRQILLNILGNSVKFTQNGFISVEAERMAEDFVEIRVSDTGIGINDGDLDRIFEDFVTLDSSYGRTEAGTGLGLGITKRMIEAMGGTIGVESVKDEGSLFWVKLVLPQTQIDENVEGTALEKEYSPIVGQNILVVEDNHINLFVVREMLEKDGHTVVEAHDGKEGVALCKKQKFDAILMDISMPRMDGIEATTAIREGNGPSAKTPIIALTAHALPDEIIKFNEAGMNDTLIKPISRKQLRKSLRVAFNIEKPLDDDARDVGSHLV